MLDLMKPLDIGFRAHGRAGLDKKEDYVKLKEAGCDLIAWGIESGSQEILNKMNNGNTKYARKWYHGEMGLLTKPLQLSDYWH